MSWSLETRRMKGRLRFRYDATSHYNCNQPTGDGIDDLSGTCENVDEEKDGERAHDKVYETERDILEIGRTPSNQTSAAIALTFCRRFKFRTFADFTDKHVLQTGWPNGDLQVFSQTDRSELVNFFLARQHPNPRSGTRRVFPYVSKSERSVCDVFIIAV